VNAWQRAMEGSELSRRNQKSIVELAKRWQVFRGRWRLVTPTARVFLGQGFWGCNIFWGLGFSGILIRVFLGFVGFSSGFFFLFSPFVHLFEFVFFSLSRMVLIPRDLVSHSSRNRLDFSCHTTGAYLSRGLY
jgi:hypothetical protein